MLDVLHCTERAIRKTAGYIDRNSHVLDEIREAGYPELAAEIEAAKLQLESEKAEEQDDEIA
jgi:hypothetical protein